MAGNNLKFVSINLPIEIALSPLLSVNDRGWYVTLLSDIVLGELSEEFTFMEAKGLYGVSVLPALRKFKELELFEFEDGKYRPLKSLPTPIIDSFVARLESLSSKVDKESQIKKLIKSNKQTENPNGFSEKQPLSEASERELPAGGLRGARGKACKAVISAMYSKTEAFVKEQGKSTILLEEMKTKDWSRFAAGQLSQMFKKLDTVEEIEEAGELWVSMVDAYLIDEWWHKIPLTVVNLKKFARSYAQDKKKISKTKVDEAVSSSVTYIQRSGLNSQTLDLLERKGAFHPDHPDYILEEKLSSEELQGFFDAGLLGDTIDASELE